MNIPGFRHGEMIIVEVSREFSVPPAEIRGPSQLAHIVAARHEAMRRIRFRLNWSLPRIGRIFGGRHHSTVKHAIEKGSQSRGPDRSKEYLLSQGWYVPDERRVS